MSSWTDELKAEAVKRYTEANPTPETSTEIVAEIAEDMGFTTNGVRMVLSKAGVYVAKAKAAKKASSGESKASGTRVSKDAAHAALADAISANGHEADMEIIGKLTGKAAMYLAGVMKSAD